MKSVAVTIIVALTSLCSGVGHSASLFSSGNTEFKRGETVIFRLGVLKTAQILDIQANGTVLTSGADFYVPLDQIMKYKPVETLTVSNGVTFHTGEKVLFQLGVLRPATILDMTANGLFLTSEADFYVSRRQIIKYQPVESFTVSKGVTFHIGEKILFQLGVLRPASIVDITASGLFLTSGADFYVPLRQIHKFKSVAAD
jgi:hypothetical protein